MSTTIRSLRSQGQAAFASVGGCWSRCATDAVTANLLGDAETGGCSYIFDQLQCSSGKVASSQHGQRRPGGSRQSMVSFLNLTHAESYPQQRASLSDLCATFTAAAEGSWEREHPNYAYHIDASGVLKDKDG
jgi:hypothetical protein